MELEKFAPKAVLFDMDGLLLDTEIVYQRVWTESVASFGFQLTHDLFLQLLGRGRKGALQRISEIFGPGLPIADLSAELDSREHRYFTENPLNLKRGAIELLKFLGECNLPRAIATSTRRVQAERRLEAAGVRPFFTDIAAGDEVAVGKPAPDIFILAAKRLGVSPSGCIVLEDSENGIRAAHAAGMLPIMVPDLLQPSTEVRGLARSVFPDLIAVQKWMHRELSLPTPRQTHDLR